MSDLHLEFHPDEGAGFIRSLNPDDCDVLVLAGDISAGKNRIKRTLERFAGHGFKQIVYVFGNHEYYGASALYLRNSIKQWIKEQGYKQIHFLENETVEIDGVKFVGSTLWFPDTPATRSFQYRLNDFSKIKQVQHYIWQANRTATKFLKENVTEGCIVVTHHAPTHKSVASGFRGDKLNCYYVSDQSELILDNKPALWFHGHVHDDNDYIIGDTHVLSHPYGYIHLADPDWDERTVEI